MSVSSVYVNHELRNSYEKHDMAAAARQHFIFMVNAMLPRLEPSVLIMNSPSYAREWYHTLNIPGMRVIVLHPLYSTNDDVSQTRWANEHVQRTNAGDDTFKLISGTNASLENFIGSQTHIDAITYANTMDDRPMLFVQTDLGYYTAGREFLVVREGDLVLQSCMNLLDNFYSCTPGNFFSQSS